jgi:RNA polymerase sigma-70 factor, ECF subfamily
LKAFSDGRENRAEPWEPVLPTEEVLSSIVARCQSAWPDVPIEGEVFARHLGERVLCADLERARVEDLWIACACGGPSGEARNRALALIEERYLPDVDGALHKMGLPPDRIGDVKQGLRNLLFVGDVESPARIREYRGSGDLRAWMRVTAMRAALKLLRKDARETSSDDALLEARAPEDDPELTYMKAAYRAAFKAAFQEALESLTGRERTLLKQQIVDGLGIDELGALYQIHRATAARWVASAREKLLSRTRRTFMLQARISSDECESIMRMVRSQLDVSLHRRLATT